MSFLAGRLAGQEGAYFFQESKKAITRLAQNLPKKSSPTTTYDVSKFQEKDSDILPEILKHSLPPKIFQSQHYSSEDSNFTVSKSKWAVHVDPNHHPISSSDAINPLRAYVSMPQVTFGPKRWEFPNAEYSFSPSTANDLRRDRNPTPLNPEKLKAAAEGLSQIGKAFAIATAAVFGGSALIFGLIVSKLELRNSDDIRTKGKELVQPKFITIKEELAPFRIWAENMSKRWKIEKDEGNMRDKHVITKKLTSVLGVKSSS